MKPRSTTGGATYMTPCQRRRRSCASRSSSGGGFLDLHPPALLSGVVVERGAAEIAADARFAAHAAPRQAHVSWTIGVDPDGAGIELVGHAVRPIDVAGPNRGRKAVVGAIGEGDGLSLAGEPLHRDDR